MVGRVSSGTTFGLTPGQQEYAAWARERAGEVLARFDPAGAPGRSAHDGAVAHDAINRPLVKALGESGLLRGLYGGRPDEPPRDAAAMQLCLLRETLATIDTEAETALALQGLGSYPILQAGTEATRERWLPGVVAGDVVAAFALSEPDAGSDAAALSLEARPDGDGWTLHGQKTWISHAPGADVYSVFARTTAESRARGVTAFAVAGASPGLTGVPLDMLASHALGTLTFDGVRVGPDDVLGEVDRGFAVAMRTLDLFRPSVGAFAVGMAQAALDASVAWAWERQLFGGRLCDLQATQHTLAEMATRIGAGRLLVRAAAAAYDGGAAAGDVTTSAAMAKLFATEMAQWVVDQAVQLHGARGLQRGHLLERLYREVRAPRIYEGASEVQRTIIARGLLEEST
jgi:acyl-CoA dehydrogenase